MRYYADFGCSRSNRVRISRGELAKLASARATPPWEVGMEGVADHLKTNHSSMCYHAQCGRSSLKSVVIDIKLQSWGALELLPFGTDRG